MVSWLAAGRRSQSSRSRIERAGRDCGCHRPRERGRGEGMDDAAAAKARRQAIAEIEKESFDRTGLRSDVVTLYRGGRYHLYTYQKYTDVRLVFAPEFAAAFFGGDPDNFEFPRLRPRRGVLPGLSRRQAREAWQLSRRGAPRHQGRRPGVRRRESRLDIPAEHGGASGIPARRRAAAELGICCRTGRSS